MKIETNYLDDHQVQLTVEVDPEPLDAAKRRAARKLAQRTKIPGFRPGKAPYQVVERLVGEAAIMDEAVEILVNEIYPEVIEQAEIKPFAAGSLDNIPSIDPLTLVFTVPLAAETKLGDYHGIRLPYEPEEITDKQVERVLSDLRDRQAIIEPADRAAQEGDLVYVQLRAVRSKTEEGNEPEEIIPERSVPVIIEPEDANTTEDEWPYPGFSRQLIGMAVGETLQYSYTYQQDAPFESLRGESAEFFVTLNEVKARTLPELNDEFASSLGEYADLPALRQAIFEDLKTHSESQYNSEYDDQALEKLVEISEFKYPAQMLENEIGNVIHRLEHDLQQQKLDLDLYLKSRQMDMDGLREEVQPVAEARLKKSLALIELSEAEAIKVDPDELQNETNRTLNQLNNLMPEAEMRKLIKDDERRTDLISNVMMDMIIARSQERLRTIASGQYQQKLDEPSPAALEEDQAVEAEKTAVSESSSEPDQTAAGEIQQ